MNGKGSKPRPVKGDVFRNNWNDIFRHGQKEPEIVEEISMVKEKKPKKKICPHCANVFNNNRNKKCRRCGFKPD